MCVYVCVCVCVCDERARLCERRHARRAKRQNGRVGVTKVATKLLLCLCGDKTTHFGTLKLKAETLAAYLEEPFSLLVR